MSALWTEIKVSEGMSEADLSGSGFRFIKGFGLLDLQDKNEYVFAADESETGILILEGSCDIDIEGKSMKGLGSRGNVFSGLPTAVYIPKKTGFAIRSPKAQVAVCRAECDVRTKAAVTAPDQVKVMDVGRDNWAREVRIAIGPASPSVNMIIGETLNPPGNWSGTPPHKHEGNDALGESLHEELYYFRTDKPQGWGMERLYSPDRGINELIYLKSNVVTFMPWGYHQIVSAPGYTLYYLFFLAGKGKGLSGHEDPDHNWIKQVDNGGNK